MTFLKRKTFILSLLTGGLESLLLEDEDALDEDAFEAVAAAFLRAGMMDVRACQAW